MIFLGVLLTVPSHGDHAGGNKEIVSLADLFHSVSTANDLQLAALGDKTVIGGKDCAAVTFTPKNGEVYGVGEISLKALYTPCHTQDSICWFAEDTTGKAVFTGDTLFIGGMWPDRIGGIYTDNSYIRMRKVLRGHR